RRRAGAGVAPLPGPAALAAPRSGGPGGGRAAGRRGRRGGILAAAPGGAGGRGPGDRADHALVRRPSGRPPSSADLVAGRHEDGAAAGHGPEGPAGTEGGAGPGGGAAEPAGPRLPAGPGRRGERATAVSLA